jgi:hypothetical protein
MTDFFSLAPNFAHIDLPENSEEFCLRVCGVRLIAFRRFCDGTIQNLLQVTQKIDGKSGWKLVHLMRQSTITWLHLLFGTVPLSAFKVDQYTSQCCCYPQNHNQNFMNQMHLNWTLSAQ